MMLTFEKGDFYFSENAKKEVLDKMEKNVMNNFANCYVMSTSPKGKELGIDDIYPEINEAMDETIATAKTYLNNLADAGEKTTLRLQLQDLPIYDSESDIFIILDENKRVINIMPSDFLRQKK